MNASSLLLYAAIAEWLDPKPVRLPIGLKCMALVFKDRKQAGDDAAWWLKTYCRHWARNCIDWQTLDNLNAAERVIARQHMGTLRRLGRLREGGFRGNFEVVCPQ